MEEKKRSLEIILCFKEWFEGAFKNDLFHNFVLALICSEVNRELETLP